MHYSTNPFFQQATGAHGDGTAKSAHEITNCDFKCSNSRAFRWNMKSAGNRSTFLLTACTNALGSTLKRGMFGTV